MKICHIVIYITRILITVFLILRDIFVNLLNRQIRLCFECIIVNVFFLEVIFTCVWYFIYRWKSRYIQCIIIESLIVYYWSIILSTQFIIWRYLPGIMLWYLNLVFFRVFRKRGIVDKIIYAIFAICAVILAFDILFIDERADTFNASLLNL